MKLQHRFTYGCEYTNVVDNLLKPIKKWSNLIH